MLHTTIRRFLTSTATATLVSAVVLSRIDYSNSLLFGSTHDVKSHLQRTLNYKGVVILLLPMLSNITTHIISLKWHPVNGRSTYIITSLCYHRHSNKSPSNDNNDNNQRHLIYINLFALFTLCLEINTID